MPLLGGVKGIRGKAAHAILNDPVYCAPYPEKPNNARPHTIKRYSQISCGNFLMLFESPYPPDPSPRGEGVLLTCEFLRSPDGGGVNCDSMSGGFRGLL